MVEYQMVNADIWNDPILEMTAQEKYFYLYLLTNRHVNRIGIYRISRKLMACQSGYSVEDVTSLMERFMNHHKLICYNPETYELAIKNWGKHIKLKGGKRSIISELEQVKDLSLISYVSGSIHKEEIRRLYESFCN
ncbi:hypothetical protein FS935_21145 [Metabacillus litoralis]|uniref:Uncharacterized protein n=1 Tax=Metabacillus litoralis TaxID=152268 RepID=A0A5C6VC76_9BACI|nr:hypothetical protein [Metabacillus litoralis]TXC82206.1 hypothetical protein FS935_21145 [Metabacillus litoralis]